MENIKLFLPTIFFMLTAVFSFAINHNGRSLLPCSTHPNSPANTQYETTVCSGHGLLCCYVPNTIAEIQRPF